MTLKENVMKLNENITRIIDSGARKSVTIFGRKV